MNNGEAIFLGFLVFTMLMYVREMKSKLLFTDCLLCDSHTLHIWLFKNHKILVGNPWASLKKLSFGGGC